MICCCVVCYWYPLKFIAGCWTWDFHQWCSVDETIFSWMEDNFYSFKAADTEEQKVKQEGKQMLSQRNVCDVICLQHTWDLRCSSKHETEQVDIITAQLHFSIHCRAETTIFLCKCSLVMMDILLKHLIFYVKCLKHWGYTWDLGWHQVFLFIGGMNYCI